ncbi:MAG TPA: hypothetical protein VFZ89_03520 [Solirubrobacteraceae bacterium]
MPVPPSELSRRLEQLLARPELQKVFDEAGRLAKTPGARERIDEAKRTLERRCSDSGDKSAA